jgi:hypothetical protein
MTAMKKPLIIAAFAMLLAGCTAPNVYTYSPETQTYLGNSASIAAWRAWATAHDVPYASVHFYDAYNNIWSDASLWQGRRLLVDNPEGDSVGDICSGSAFGTMGPFVNCGERAGTKSADICAELSGKPIASARIWIKRMPVDKEIEEDSPNPQPITMYAATFDVIPYGDISTECYHIADLAPDAGGWFSLPLPLAQAVVDGKCLVIYSGDANYTALYGAWSEYGPKIEITCGK